MRAVVGFCGAGGSSIGVHDAGFDVVGFDFWQPAVDTHNANGLPAHLHDLSDPALDHLIPGCDLMWLSPPCQPFSAAGDGEGEFDERDGFPWALRIIGKKLPPVVLIENVKGLTFAKHSAYFGGVLAELRGFGYEVEWRVLNTADHGVPQTRERCIIVARRDAGRITWPMPTHSADQDGMFTAKWVTMAEALGWGDGLAIEYSRGAGLIERHGERRPHPFAEPAPTISSHAEKDFRIVLDSPTVGTMSGGQWVVRATDQRTPNGASHTPTYDPTTRPARTVTEVGGQWWLERPATTIAGDTRVFQPGGHHQPGEQSENAIRLTIAELARLQDFPADWIWTGTKTQQARMIGNAVPPTLARVVAEANMPAHRAERAA